MSVPTQAGSTKASLEQLIERTLDIPTIPAVASKVILATNDPNSTAAKIAKIIEADQGISARILRVCNSAMYGLQRKVTSLQHAITILGFRELKHLVLSASTRNLYKSFGPVEQQLWEHSIGCALASHMVAEKLHPPLRELAFLAGQMHDIGKVIIKNRLPTQFDQVLVDAKTVGTLAAESKNLGFTHTDVGSLIMKRWNMPEGVEMTAFHHHDLSLAESIAKDHLRLVACVAVANHICHLAGIGSVEEDIPEETQINEALQVFGTGADILPALVEAFRDKFKVERSLFT